MAAKYSKTADASVVASNGYNGGTLSGDDAYVLYSRLGTLGQVRHLVRAQH